MLERNCKCKKSVNTFKKLQQLISKLIALYMTTLITLVIIHILIYVMKSFQYTLNQNRMWPYGVDKGCSLRGGYPRLVAPEIQADGVICVWLKTGRWSHFYVASTWNMYHIKTLMKLSNTYKLVLHSSIRAYQSNVSSSK